MSALARPAVLASLLAALALLLQPALGAASWLPAHDLVSAALALLLALGLLARALSAPPAERAHRALVAAGAIALVVALGADGARGRQGTLSLAAGQSRVHFDETGRGGRALGLRPLGFQLGVERVSVGGEVLLALQSGQGRSEQWLRPGGSIGFAGFRVAAPRLVPTGGASRLRVSLSDGAKTEVADVVPGGPVSSGGVTLTLEQYFPDFALDERQQPFSRSLEPKNPAALLGVQRGGQSYRAFVLQSMPGVHRVEPLGLAFSLLEVEPEQSIEMTVHREPFALLALGGALLLAAGLLWTLLAPGREASPAGAWDGVLVAGAALAGALLVADRGRVLAWSFSVPIPAGEAVLPGVGALLASALLAAAAGTLLLAAGAVAGGGETRGTARCLLWLAAAAGALGCVLGLVRAWALPAGLDWVGVAPLAGLALAVGLVSIALRRPEDHAGASRAALAIATLLALAGSVAAGVAGSESAGTYATTGTASWASAALLGLCVLEPTAATGGRALGFALAVLTRLLRPL